MKLRILCLLLTISCFSVAQAQSFEIVTADTLVIEEESNVLAEAHAQIRNTTNNTIRTLVSREVISSTPGHFNYFCWGVNCYAPVTSQSPDTLPVDPLAINNSFKGYIDADNNDGISIVKYCFINASNPSDRACFTARYQFGVTAIAGNEPGKAVAVPAMYDPYSQTVRINVNGGKIETWNMIGQKIELKFQYDGTSMVADASSLKPGYYFLFGNSDNKVWSARVIVTK